ncbi:MAG TPA: hypothetical protein VEG39_03250 [Clostridia bacterium]|nr:hypothetical protein [Clostridia bacterium]
MRALLESQGGVEARQCSLTKGALEQKLERGLGQRISRPKRVEPRK